MHVRCNQIMVSIEICEENCDEMGKEGCGYIHLLDGINQPRPEMDEDK